MSPAERVLAVLSRHGTAGPLVVAASGGADSTALAWLVAGLRDAGRLPFPAVVLAHCDHRQHERSTAMAAHVEHLAGRIAFGFALERLDLPRHASEAAMRDARYAALAKVARACGAGVVATAHHRDDQAETVVLRALRGTGRRGLGGMAESRALGPALRLVRPLLDVDRAALRRLLALADLPWVEDPTNRAGARARIRHEVLPHLHARGVTAPRIAAFAAAVRTEADALERAARAWLAARARAWGPGRLDVAPLAAHAPDLAREVLRLAHLALAGGEAPRGRWLDAAMRIALAAAPGAVARGTVDIERARTGLALARPPAGDPAPAAPLPLAADGVPVAFGPWFRIAAEAVPPAAPVAAGDRSAASFDATAAPPPWRLRAARGGDRVDVAGLDRPVALHRALQARGVPRLERARTPVVVDAEDRIVWAPGLDVAAFARLGPETTAAIRLARLAAGGIPLAGARY